uniref:Uncharacterized protein n=1 Tax=Glossina brevipalpis TaxID=37001 RepID=A0A1A9W639_9MUSC
MYDIECWRNSVVTVIIATTVVVVHGGNVLVFRSGSLIESNIRFHSNSNSVNTKSFNIKDYACDNNMLTLVRQNLFAKAPQRQQFA